ncbi:TIR domain-containing protein [Zoogloeaceae bacterium G21618-S1]|nr:TIR domain-containing protein [Zoogloeaceae bacterium G21618-S1]
MSWSGARSKAVAQAFNSWLPEVIQSLRPWHSDDLEKGRRWDDGIAAQLNAANVGIICLTSDNLDSPWIHFEAGALSKLKSDALVCTFLLDVTPSDVRPPLGNFQHTEFKREDVLKLLRNINECSSAGGNGLPEERLKTAFDRCWPDLEALLSRERDKRPTSRASKTVRSERDLLEEVLEGVRRIEGWSNELVNRLPRLSIRDRVQRSKSLTLADLAPRGAQLSEISVGYPTKSDLAFQDFHVTPSKVQRDVRSVLGREITEEQAEVVHKYLIELLVNEKSKDYAAALTFAANEVGL